MFRTNCPDCVEAKIGISFVPTHQHRKTPVLATTQEIRIHSPGALNSAVAFHCNASTVALNQENNFWLQPKVNCGARAQVVTKNPTSMVAIMNDEHDEHDEHDDHGDHEEHDEHDKHDWHKVKENKEHDTD